MIVSDFSEVLLIDEAITDLQGQLTDLYQRRKSILHPTTPARQASKRQTVNFDQLDLSLDHHAPLSLGKSHRAK